MQKQNKDYGKVVSIRMKKETERQLEIIKNFYSKQFNLELSNSDVINMLLVKEAKEKNIKI